MTPGFACSVRFSGRQEEIQLADDDPEVAALAAEICSRLGLAPATLKLLGAGKGALVPSSVAPGTRASSAGLKAGARLMAVGSRVADVEIVRQAEGQAATARLPSFEHEAKLAVARKRGARDVQPPPFGTKHTFGGYEVMRSPGLTPSPDEALRLLYRLASDPGILAVMDKHGFDVGKLAEMPPEGLVGVDPVCVLGYNTNKGETIHLRLRTDDVKGFRKYQAIRATLCHELAHNVWGEHDGNFKALCSQLNKEVEEVAARRGRFAAFDDGGMDCGAADALGVAAQALHPAMAATATSSGKSLRQLAKTSTTSTPVISKGVPAGGQGRTAEAVPPVGVAAQAPVTSAPASEAQGPGVAARPGAVTGAQGSPGAAEGSTEEDGGDVGTMYEHYDSKTDELEKKQRALEQ